jgi:uncharacterized repeat protein (TIGR01451 family)
VSAATSATTLSDTASVTTAGDNNAANNSFTNGVAITASPDLAISKTASSIFVAGSTATFSIFVNNASQGPTVGGITVTDTLNANFTFVSGTGTGWACSAVAQVVTCTNSGPIAGGAPAANIVLTVAVNVAATGSIGNTATVQTTDDNNAANNSSTATVTITAASPDLSITKTVSGAFVAGSNGTFQIAVSNIGTAATTGTITVTDTLNSAFTFVSGTGTSWTCAAVLQVVTCTNPGPVAGGSATGNITLTVNIGGGASGSIANTATVADPGDTTDVADKSSTATATFGAPPTANCGNAPTGNESMLHGQYAFRLQGWQGSGNGLPIAMAGSFNTDGTGKIGTLTGGIGGDLDIGAQHKIIAPSSTTSNSLYKVGPDGTGSGFLGCVVLTTSFGNTTADVTFTFSLNAAVAGVASKGRIIEFDTGSAARAAGEIMLQDTAAFSGGNTSALHANYAFGGSGQGQNKRFAIAGSFTLNPATGAMSAVAFDSDSAGTLLNVASTTGSLPPASVSALDGRATLSISQALLTGGLSPASAIVYIVNANEMFLLSADPSVIYSGKIIVSAASYTSAAIVGNQMFHVTGQNQCTISTPCASVGIGALSFAATNSTSGTFTGDIFNFDTTNLATTMNIPAGTFTLTSASGRLAIANAGGNPPVLYLATPATNTEPITAFLVGTDNSVIFGASEAGASGAITTASLAGKYFVGNDEPADNTVKDRIEVVTIASNGTFIGTGNSSGSSGLQLLRPDSGTITITNTPDVGVGNAGVLSILITNGKRILVIDESSSAPAILIIELQ